MQSPNLLHIIHIISTTKESKFRIATNKLQLHDAIYRLRSYSNSLIHILSLSNSHNNAASIQKNRDDKSHRVIVAIVSRILRSSGNTITNNRVLPEDRNIR